MPWHNLGPALTRQPGLLLDGLRFYLFVNLGPFSKIIFILLHLHRNFFGACYSNRGLDRTHTYGEVDIFYCHETHNNIGGDHPLGQAFCGSSAKFIFSFQLGIIFWWQYPKPQNSHLFLCARATQSEEVSVFSPSLWIPIVSKLLTFYIS